MPELARRIASRLRQLIGERRRARRCNAAFGVTVSLASSSSSSNGFRRTASLSGYTADVSLSGLALILPAIRIGGQYLVGGDRRLRLTLELPAGPVEMEVAPVRYESLEETAEPGYLVGVRIVEMKETDRSGYDESVRRLLRGKPLN